MLEKIGTAKELKRKSLPLPQEVIVELAKALTILDCAYGEDRDYFKSGGYAIVATTTEDVKILHSITEKASLECVVPCGNYINTLYLLGDNYAITTFIEKSVVPQNILNEMRKDNENY